MDYYKKKAEETNSEIEKRDKTINNIIGIIIIAFPIIVIISMIGAGIFVYSEILSSGNAWAILIYAVIPGLMIAMALIDYLGKLLVSPKDPEEKKYYKKMRRINRPRRRAIFFIVLVVGVVIYLLTL